MNTEQKIKEAFEAWLSSELEKMGADDDMRAAIQRDSKYGLVKFRAGYLALLNSLEPSNLICNTHMLYRLPKGVKQ